jgi:hypothetical protein
LAPREYRIYTYTIFDLQHFFNESFARAYPQMLSQDKVDTHFIEQICRLNADPIFWSGMKTTDWLHDYLIRYVLMHFDYEYGPSSYMEDHVWRFINDRRDYRPSRKRTTVTLKKASTILGKTRDELKKMNRQELARLYRRKAQELHPDKGGDHDRFVGLTEAYHTVMHTKK